MFQLLYLRFTQPRADPTAFAAMSSQAKALLANQHGESRRGVRPDDRRRAERQPSAAPARDAGHGGQVGSREVARVLQGALRRRRATSRSSSSAASRPRRSSRWSKPTSPACRRRTRSETWRDLGITPPSGVVEKTIEKGIAPKSQVAIVFSGPFVYDDTHQLALRAMTMVLQSRLFDTIRQELGGTYSITATPDAREVPAAANTASASSGRATRRGRRALVQRVFEEIAFVRNTPYSAGQVGRDPRGAAARVRAEQPGQRLPAQPDRAAGTRKARRPTSPPRSTCRTRSPR